MVLYSHSRISTFLNCPYRFKLKYIEKIRPEIEQSVEAFLGSTVHETMEKLYRDMKFQKIATLKELISYFRDQWEKNWSPSILIVRKDYKPENYMKMGEKFITDYYNTHKPFDQTKTVGLEQRIVIDLNRNGKYKLQGYIDRLALTDDGTYEIHDYKTNSSLPLKEYLEEDRQLALYALAVKDSYPNARKIRLVWHFLSFNQDVMLEKTNEELEKLKLSVISDIERIESAKDFPTKKSNLCEWCEFRSMCPEWAHIARTEGLSLKNFLKEPGVSLVNRYAELTAKRKEIDAEMDAVKEKLTEFAKENKVTTVGGSGYAARIWSAEKFKFPGKNDEGRADLEDFLNKAGLMKDVAALDTFLLSNKMEDTDWPEEIKNAVAKFGRKELIERIYLRKKNCD